MSPAGALLRRELALSWSRGGGPLLAFGFFAATTVILPLAAGPSVERLAVVAGGAPWVALALASLLSLDRLFANDLENGVLELLVLGPLPLPLVASIKCLGQWLTTIAPVALAAPAAAISLGAPASEAPMVAATALVGSVAFSFVGGAGAALAVASRRGGILIALLVLPLIAPPVIFGGGAIWSFAAGLDWTAPFALLAAYTFAAVGLAPLVMAAACRNALA